MNNEGALKQMTIESLQVQSKNQQTLIHQLSSENEELFHQYNHLMVRNGKLLKRVDDLQEIIDSLHLRIQELQLINGNMMKLNDRLKQGHDTTSSVIDYHNIKSDNINKLKTRSDEVNDNESSNLSSFPFDMDALYLRWKNHPGQSARNAPNLKKQVLMLVHLYQTKSLRAESLFSLCGVGGVTGARYVSSLKKYGLIRFTGARKKGAYEITRQGIEFLESRNSLIASLPREEKTGGEIPEGILLKPAHNPAIMDPDDL